MNAAQRGQLLRERFRAIREPFLPQYGEAAKSRKMEWKKRGGSCRSHIFFSVSLCERHCEWVPKPNKFPNESLPIRRRREGEPVLARIAVLAPKKLRRVPVIRLSKICICVCFIFCNKLCNRAFPVADGNRARFLPHPVMPHWVDYPLIFALIVPFIRSIGCTPFDTRRINLDGQDPPSHGTTHHFCFSFWAWDPFLSSACGHAQSKRRGSVGEERSDESSIRSAFDP